MQQGGNLQRKIKEAGQVKCIARPMCHEMTNTIIFRNKEDACHRNPVTAFCCGLFPVAEYIKIFQESSLTSCLYHISVDTQVSTRY